jgi:hypothetical protein
MEPEPKATTSEEVLILLVSGTCCFPQLAALDQQARQIIDQALKETGMPAQVRMVTASSAVTGGIPFEILQSSGLASNVSNIMRLPAVLINNQLISFGVPKLDVIKNALSSVQK